MKHQVWNPVGIVCVGGGDINVYIAVFHQKCIYLFFFFVLSVVASLLLLGLSGATRKDTAGNLPRHHSCHIFFPSLNTRPLFSPRSAHASLLFPRAFQWKTTQEWNLQDSAERGWRNRKEASSLLPITRTSTPQTLSVFTSLKVNTFLIPSLKARCVTLKGIRWH